MVLAYDDTLQLLSWGYPALVEEPSWKTRKHVSQTRPVELFKLHLANVKEDEKPPLPLGLDAKRAITDYLHEMNKVSSNKNSDCMFFDWNWKIILYYYFILFYFIFYPMHNIIHLYFL